MDMRSRKKPPLGFFSWIDAEKAKDPESELYPLVLMQALNFTKSSTWDYLYLTFFLIWLLLEFVVQDGIATKYAPKDLIPMNNITVPDIGGLGGGSGSAGAAALGLPPAAMYVPLILMFVLQLVPTFGIIYFVCRCNDLTKFVARRNFGTWAFNSVLVAMSVEYFFYGGRGREKLAGTCRINPERNFFSMMGMGKKEAVQVSEGVIRHVEDDDSDVDVEESSSEEEDDIESRINEYAADAAANGGEGVGQEEMSMYAKMLKEKREREEEERRTAAAARAAARLLVTDWTEWTCVVCGKDNREPTHPEPISDVFFGFKGVYYKRLFAIIRRRRDAPQCTHCLTYSDYVPPVCSAHTFPYNTKPHVAFENYPIKASVQAGLSDNRFVVFMHSLMSCLFGIQNNSSSKLTYNDWRLRLYLAGRFPELPRQVKPVDELYELGEFVQCRLQKSDWATCKIIAARENHTYDIRCVGRLYKYLLSATRHLTLEPRTTTRQDILLYVILNKFVLFLPPWSPVAQ